MTTDKIITDAEIQPAIPELNKWAKIKFPGWSGSYSAPNLVGPSRLIALLIAKMMANGFKPIDVSLPYKTKEQYVVAALDLLRSASYPEMGGFINATAGNLNDIPGGVLLNLIEQGATIDAQSGGASKDELNQASQDGYRKGWNECLSVVRSGLPHPL